MLYLVCVCVFGPLLLSLLQVETAMHLMYYLDENGKRVYTLKVSIDY